MCRCQIGLLCVILFLGGACLKKKDPNAELQNTRDRFKAMRERMVKTQIKARGISDERVLEAMRRVPRHKFIPENLQSLAYDDSPVPIGENQTISQPYIVALMTESLKLDGDENVLEIGTGSGYQAAVLAELVGEVYSIEIVQSLCDQATKRLQNLGYKNVHVQCGDGYQGWPEHAPFDGIIVTAAPNHIPQPLIDQLKPGGRLIIPVGEWFQELMLITKGKDGKIKKESIIPVRFVPMTGEAMDKPKKK